MSWPSVGYAAGLSAIAGFVDGVAYLDLGGYFVSFMSGNTTRASAELLHGSISAVALALGLVGFFTLGVVASSLAFGRARRYRRSLVLALTAMLLAAGAIAPVFGAAAVTPPLLAMSMGAVNTSYTRNGEVSVGLTYMTGTLVKAGQHFAAALTGGRHSPWLKYFALWAMILLGAVVGAFCYHRLNLGSLWIATVAMIAWTAIAALRARRRTVPAASTPL
jgi:uncharacterized membrane protein YoaK (UPF0700 family)